MDGVIGPFDPASRIGTFQPKALASGPIFSRVSPGRLILDALRKAGEPMPMAASVAYVVDAIEQGERRAKGRLQKTDGCKTARWTLA